MIAKANSHSLLHRIGRWCWALLVVCLLSLAAYVGAGRLLMANVSSWHTEILAQLNQRLPFTVDAQRVEGHWQFFSPVLVLEELSITARDGSSTPIYLRRGAVTLDVLASLKTRSPKLSEASLEALALDAYMDESGRLVFPGLSGGDGEFGDQLLDFLLALKQVSLIDNRLFLTAADGRERHLELDLTLRTMGAKRYLDGLVHVADVGTQIELSGSGEGDPRDLAHFNGQLFSRFHTGELEAMLGLLPEPLTYGLGSAKGTANISAWFSWRKGEPRLTLTAKAQQLALAGTERHPWRLSLNELSFSARVQEHDGVFRLWMNHFNANDGVINWQLPALQVRVHEREIYLQAQALHVDQARHFLLASGALPKEPAELISTLRPRGFISELELTVADYQKPADSWSGSARFNALAVDPWDQGVGLSGVSGYIRGDHRGVADALVDTQDFALRLPMVYHHPLLFDTVLGNVRLGWTAQRFTLQSGLIETTGEEGEARAILGLDLPFSRTPEGPKMELLVGLKDSHPRYRKKFVPHILPVDLRQWIDQAVSDDDAAKVVDAGFLYRGSLRTHSHDRRTIQLYFDVDNLGLTFDPHWPPVEDLKGLAFIDDARASIWGESGRMFQLALNNVNAEVYENDKHQVTLGVTGTSRGPAADALKLVNNSPLKTQIDNALDDWKARGSVSAEIDLTLNLENMKAPPSVSVQTKLEQLGLTLGTTDIQLTDGKGGLNYSSAKGFSSRQLTAKLWGKPLSLSLQQRGEKNTELDINFAGDVAMQRVQRWLQAKPLQIASGTTAIKGRVSIAEGETPLLYLSSNLKGVALDVPKPWGKSEQEESSLQIRAPLAGEVRHARVVLGATLLADIAMKGNDLLSASIGVGEEPAPVELGHYVLNGTVSELNADQWHETVQRYFMADSDQIQQVKLMAVDKLMVGRLQLLGREFDQVQLSAHQNAQSWQVQASNGLAKFLLNPNPEGEGLQLQIPRLDLELFAGESLEENTMNAEEAWPLIAVTVEQLSNKGSILGDLHFDLSVQKEQITASDIVGDVSGIALREGAPARMVWRMGEFAWTRFNGRMHFSNLGDVLTNQGYQRVIETDTGVLNVDVTWPGSPHDMGLKDARGSLQLAIGEGRFLKTSAATSNALRVIGILNLADFVSRLSLDISPFVKSGIVFDSITGDIALAQNDLVIHRVDVNGRSSRFILSGNADVLNQTMDAELGVTLPVTNNLPLVAAATGAWPLAAGLFVAGQVFGDQIDKIASMVYQVEGSWQDPEVSLERLFDGNAAEVKKLSANEPNSQLDQTVQ